MQKLMLQTIISDQKALKRESSAVERLIILKLILSLVGY